MTQAQLSIVGLTSRLARLEFGWLPGTQQGAMAHRHLDYYLDEFTFRFNRQHGRFGTLWAERFKSVLVEDQPGVVQTVAAYVDLNPVRAGKVEVEPEAVRRELKRQGELSLGQVLRLRVRYFTDGVVLGSRSYVNGVFAEFRERFGPRRKSGARRMRGLEALGELATMRDLQVEVVG
jgi:hypothetical protein